MHENIRIVGNSFEGDRLAIRAKSVKGLLVSGNRSKPNALKVYPEESCSEVKIENNTYEK